jgi:hypothetical protein
MRIIRRDDAPHWPQVVAKTFTVDGAARLFDRIFAGEAPGCARTWLAADMKTRGSTDVSERATDFDVRGVRAL